MDRRIVLVAAICLLVLAWMTFSSLDTPLPSVDRDVVESSQTDTVNRQKTAPVKLNHPVPSGAERAATPMEPIIESVTIDKTEVCRGEENFIRVRAHSREGQSDEFVAVEVYDPNTYLTYRGTDLAYILREAPSAPLEVSVRGRDGSVTSTTLSPISLKDCDVPAYLKVEVTREPGADDRRIFHAIVQTAKGQPSVTPVQWDWDFGDGSTAGTTKPNVEHSYENREQRIADSSFVVRVVARDLSGNEIAGVITETLLNRGFVSKVYKNEVKLEVGRTADDIWLYHGYGEDVRVEELRLVTTEEGQTETQEIDPNTVLIRVPRHESIVLQSLDTLRPERSGISRYLEVRGRTTDGISAFGKVLLFAEGQ